MSIEEMKSELTANQGQFRSAQSDLQLAGDEIEKIHDITSVAMDKIGEVQRMFSPVESALGQISASGQLATSKYTIAVEKLFALTGEAADIHAISARNYGSIILDVLQGRADQNLPVEFTQITQHVNTVLRGLAMATDSLADLRLATTVAEDTVALVAGTRPHTKGYPAIAAEGLTPAVLKETSAFISKA